MQSVDITLEILWFSSYFAPPIQLPHHDRTPKEGEPSTTLLISVLALHLQ